jgi:hypothetical protein
MTNKILRNKRAITISQISCQGDMAMSIHGGVLQKILDRMD